MFSIKEKPRAIKIAYKTPFLIELFEVSDKN